MSERMIENRIRKLQELEAQQKEIEAAADRGEGADSWFLRTGRAAGRRAGYFPAAMAQVSSNRAFTESA